MDDQTLQQKDVRCIGHLKRILPLLDRLHDVGRQRDKAGNRRLFFDDYVKLVLLYIWNPLLNSVHDLQRAAALPAVSKALGIKRFSAASFSESVRVFDAGQLEPIIAELAGELPSHADPRLKELNDALTLVDGTVLRGLARLVHAAAGSDGRYSTLRDGRPVYAWRLHTQFDLRSFTPHRLDRTGGRNGGKNREGNVLRENLEAGRCYVCDGGYNDRSLFDAIVDAQSSYVIRAAENSVFAVASERLLSQEALDAGIVRDAIVELNGAGRDLTGHPVRRIEIQAAPHPCRTRRGVKQTDLLIVYTSLTELPAELVALIYRYRYTVELFFRIFKQLLGMRHLLSQREQGIDIQTNCALIVCILIQLISGKKPNKAMRDIINWHLMGMASEQDVLDFLNRPDNTGVKLKAKEELWKKLGF